MSIEQDFTIERLSASLKDALATMDRQANDEKLPASVRKRSAKSLARYQSIIKRYPILQKALEKE